MYVSKVMTRTRSNSYLLFPFLSFMQCPPHRADQKRKRAHALAGSETTVSLCTVRCCCPSFLPSSRGEGKGRRNGGTRWRWRRRTSGGGWPRRWQMEEWRLERDADDQGTGGQDEGGGESNFGSGGDGDAASSQEKLGEEQAGKLRRTIGREDPFQNKIGEAVGGR